tara:strand:- start:22 stop:294 length:273 start_codon:yes stop_codon:yes gene_type:complete
MGQITQVLEMTVAMSIIAIVASVYSIVLGFLNRKNHKQNEKAIQELNTIVRGNRLDLDTLENKVNKPKAKRGRPRKDSSKPHTIVHELGN